MKTICIAGKNDIACEICEKVLEYYHENADVNVVASITKGDDGINGWQRSYKYYCETKNVEIISLEQAYNIPELYFFSAEYDRIIKTSRFTDAHFFNVHFSLLPAYKGILPSVLPILYGEYKTGVTLHVMRDGIDTGEIVDQKEYIIDPNDFSIDLYRKLSALGSEMVMKWIPRILMGDYSCHPQSPDGSTYFGKGIIDYSKLNLNTRATAFQIRNQIRAFSFRPYQMIKWNGIEIMDCEITGNISGEKPGLVLQDNEVFFVISSIDYDVILYKDVFSRFLNYIKTGENEKAVNLAKSPRIINDHEIAHGWSPLMVAAYNNNQEMVEWLIKKGANVNDNNNLGTTVLMYAKDCYLVTGNPFVYKCLLNAGASIEAVDYNQKSIKDYVTSDQYFELNHMK